MARSMTMKRTTQPVLGAAGKVHRRCREPLGGHLGLDGGLLGGDAWVGHHPRHQIALPAGRRAPEAEGHELGPEPAGQAPRWTVEGQRGR